MSEGNQAHPAVPSKGPLHPDIVYSLIVDGDLGRLSEEQRVAYYVDRCDKLGISPGEQPFSLVRLSGKMVLYLNKSGAAALTRVNQISIEITSKGWDGESYVVQARATTPSGRYAEDLGIVDMDDEREKAAEAHKRGKKGDVISRPNAMMKATTKAKRRAIIAVCGVGLLDESELDGVRNAERLSVVQVQDAAPKCSGKAAGLAGSIERRVQEYAEALGKEPQAVYHAVLRKCEIPALDGRAPTAQELTVEQGLVVREALLRAQAKIATEPTAADLESGSIDAEFTEREPGEDRDIDDEAPTSADTFADPPGVP